MPLSWSILPASQLCIVSGEGTVTRSDIYTYLARTIAEGTKGYAKLVDITACTLALDADDLDTVALASCGTAGVIGRVRSPWSWVPLSSSTWRCC